MQPTITSNGGVLPEEGSPSVDRQIALWSKTNLRRLLVAILFVTGAILLLRHFTQMQRAVTVVRSLNVLLVGLAAIAQTLSYWGSGYLVKEVVRPGGKSISVADGAMITLGANAVGTLGGGIVATAGMTYRWLRLRAVNTGAAAIGGWLPIFLNNAILAVVSFFGVVMLLMLKKMPAVLVAGLTISVLAMFAGLVLLVWVLNHREQLDRAAMGMARALAALRRKPFHRAETLASIARFAEAWHELTRGGWNRPLAGAILNTGFDMLTLALFFRAAGHSLTFGALVAGYGLPQFLGKLTFILGGAGVVETAMVGLYASLGSPVHVAVVAVVAYRLFSLWLPTLLGMAIIPYLEHHGVHNGVRRFDDGTAFAKRY